MAMGRKSRSRQQPLWIDSTDLATAPGHPFYEKLNTLLDRHGFDEFVEEKCRRFYAPRMGRPARRTFSRLTTRGSTALELGQSILLRSKMLNSRRLVSSILRTCLTMHQTRFNRHMASETVDGGLARLSINERRPDAPMQSRRAVGLQVERPWPSAAWKVESVRVVHSKTGEVYASNHNGVLATLVLPPS